MLRQIGGAVLTLCAWFVRRGKNRPMVAFGTKSSHPCPGTCRGVTGMAAVQWVQGVLGWLARITLRAWILAGAAVLGLFAAYLLAGYYLAPGLIRSQAMAWVRTNLDKDLSLGEVRFDPLAFTVDVSDIAIPDADGPMVGVGHLRVGFSVLSVFSSAYRFTEMRIDRPFVHAVVRPDRSLNLIELVPKTKSEGPTPAVRIDLFDVSAGRIAFADRSRPGQPEETLTPIAFTLKDFHTKTDEGGGFTLDARSETGGTFSWNGKLAVAPIMSRGRFMVGGLKSDTIQKFAGPYMPVTLTGGQVGFTADYDFAYDGQGLRLHASLPSITVDALSLEGKPEMFSGKMALDRLESSIGPVDFLLGAKGGPKLTAVVPAVAVRGLSVLPPGAGQDDGLHLDAATLKDVRLDQEARRIALGILSLDGANLSARRGRDGKFDLLAMLSAKPAAAPASAAPAQPAWKISLGELALNAATLRIEDRMVSPAARFTIAPLAASVTGAGSDLTQPVTVKFDAGFNRTGKARGEVTVTPASVAGDLSFTLTRLPLRAFMAYGPPLKGLVLRSGEANASGALHFEGGNIGAVTFRGDAAINRFDMQETSTKSSLFAWRGFSFRGIDVRRNRVEIARARIDRPLGRVAVLADRSFNFTPLMPPPPATAAPVLPIKAPPAKLAPAKAAPGAMRFRLRRLDISGGAMGFADYSIEPNFEARIDAMKGAITNITNQPGQAAAIDLTGQVIDPFSPVTIKGSMDLLGYDRNTDMQLVFRNIELPVFNPYSGRYAGYAIAKGKLTTELSYKIDNRALKAGHHIVIDQLEWGAGTGSKDAVPLPIRLATSLLKDVNGVIDLDVPVTGSLDDPKFRIGPIIWQIIGNLIEKAVTAPFRLIGSLFAGADKAQFIDFVPGSAALPPQAAEALGALAKALQQKPELKLDIPAGPGIVQDATGMADTAIDMQLSKGKGRRGADLDLATLDAEDMHDALEDLYRAKLGKRPEFPEYTPEQLKAVPGVKPDADDDDRQTVLETRWLREQLRPAFAPNATQLAELGTARATAVRNAVLADGTIDPARVFTQTSATATSAEGHSRLELKFE